ncbi:MAG: hypothetical protein ACRDZV_17175 [Acidimicrobiia bacterium]
MTPKFSLIIGTAVAALVFAAPAAAVFPTVDGGDSGYAKTDTGSAVVVDKTIGEPASGAPVFDYRNETQPLSPVSVASSGNEIVLTRIGIGSALAIALALGLMLALRSPRQRPLAH